MKNVSQATRGGLALMLAVSGLVACGSKEQPPAAAAPPPEAPVATAPPAASAPAPVASAEAPPPAPAPPPAQHGHGVAAMFIAELDGLTLKPDQKTAVDGIEADLKKADEAQEASRRKLAADTADGIAAGKVDHRKTDADVKALVASVTATTPTLEDALNRLYKTLDVDQRKKVVEGLREKGKAMQERLAKVDGEGEKGHDGEHGKAHDGHDGAAHGEGHEHGGMRGGRMMKLVEELGLTPEQHKKLDPQLRDKMKAQRAAMKTKTEADMKHMMAIGDAFQGDKFDAKKAGVGAQTAEIAKARATNRLAIVETILAVLTPEQRTKFADQIRARAAEQQAQASEDDADDLGFTTAAM